MRIYNLIAFINSNNPSFTQRQHDSVIDRIFGPMYYIIYHSYHIYYLRVCSPRSSALYSSLRFNCPKGGNMYIRFMFSYNMYKWTILDGDKNFHIKIKQSGQQTPVSVVSWTFFHTFSFIWIKEKIFQWNFLSARFYELIRHVPLWALHFFTS